MQKCLKYLISCGFSISSKYSVSRIQVYHIPQTFPGLSPLPGALPQVSPAGSVGASQPAAERCPLDTRAPTKGSSRLPARSALLSLRLRGVHRTPAPSPGSKLPGPTRLRAIRAGRCASLRSALEPNIHYSRSLLY